MRRSLDRKLVDDFPDLYRDRRGDMRETALCWGFSCGDGWYPLIRDLSVDLTSIINEWWRTRPPTQKERLEKHYGGKPRASQVKEKYGSLRFYLTHHPSDPYGKMVEKAIRRAEVRSEVTCERCGAHGWTRDTGWLKTLCNRCHARRNVRMGRKLDGPSAKVAACRWWYRLYTAVDRLWWRPLRWMKRGRKMWGG